MEEPRKFEINDLLALNRLENLDDLDILQGQPLTHEQAEKLTELQKEFCISALNEGFNKLAELENGSPQIDSNNSFSSLINQIRGLFKICRGSADSSDYKNNANLATEFYKSIYEQGADLTERQKLFLEFLLGFVFVELNVRIALTAVKKMDLEDISPEDQAALKSLQIGEQSKNVIGGLKPVSDIAYRLGNKIQEIFVQKDEKGDIKSEIVDKFWTLYSQALASDPELDEAAKKVVSMRYIPQGKDINIVGIAEFLHWLGFAGEGTILEEIPELKEFKKHAINYHGNNDDTNHFANRMGLFGNIISRLKEREGKTLYDLIIKQFPEIKTINILDIGSGPQTKGIQNILGLLKSKGIEANVTASDINGKSLQELEKLADKYTEESISQPEQSPKTKIDAVLYLDLTRPWDCPSDKSDKFEVSIASIVLHHIMDENIGDDLIKQVLQNLTKATKVNGFIAWSDVGKKGYIQSPILPFNVCDREGSIPKDIYTRLSFNDLKIQTREEAGVKYYKIPYRRKDHFYATPNENVDIYNSNIFQVIEIPEDILEKLEENRGNQQECDRIEFEYFQEQQRIIGEVRSTQEQAQKALLS